MAWDIKLLLAVLVRTVLTGLDLMEEGEEYNFYMSNDQDYCLLFRTSAGENVLLFNTTNPSPEINPPDADLRSRLKLEIGGRVSVFHFTRLIRSDSGQYRWECWRKDNVTNKDTNLLVCSHSFQKYLYVDIGDRVDLRCDGTRDNETMTVQWYSGYDFKEQLPEKSSFLHIKISMEKDQYGSRDFVYYTYTCVLLEKQLCVSYKEFLLLTNRHYVVVSVGEEVVLSCFNPVDPKGTKTLWSHNLFGDIPWDPSPLTRREKQMYVTDGRSGNVSLIIPSTMLNHSGTYWCKGKNDKHTIIIYQLLVLPKSETDPLTEFFSEGDQVVVRCNSDNKSSNWVVWYRRTAEVEHVFWNERYQELYLAQALDGRINAFNTGSVLVLSNLSMNDTGEYVCAVFNEEECVLVTKTLLLKWDLFGINSTFYRVYSTLMGCALLGMVCALITVNLKAPAHCGNGRQLLRLGC